MVPMKVFFSFSAVFMLQRSVQYAHMARTSKLLKGKFQGLIGPRNLGGQTSPSLEFKPVEELQPAGLQFPNRW